MQIQYGVEITTSDPTSTDYDIGLVDGVLKWSTGRAEDLGEFKNGIIVKDSFSEVSQEIGISACGSYSTMSAFSLKVDNAESIVDTLRDLGISLIQADVIFYSFRRETSDDDWVSTQDWTGKVLDSSYDEDEFNIQFMDSFRGIHKPLLKRVFTVDEFPNLPDSIADTPMPVSIGYVAKSKLYPIIQREIYETICTYLAVDYDMVPCTNYASSGSGSSLQYTITLKTIDKTFAANELKGYFITAIKGGSETVRISGNSISAAGLTVIQLEAPFADTPVYWSVANDTVWYFQISSVSVIFMASQNPIYQFRNGDIGNGNLFLYDADSKEFEDISDLVGAISTTDISAYGYAGMTILTKPINTDGDARYYSFYTPTSLIEYLEAVTNAGAVSGTRPAIGNELPNLTDRSVATDYTWVCTSSSGALATLKIGFKFNTPVEFLKSNLVNIYFAWSWSESTVPGASVDAKYDIKLKDFLGQITNALDTTTRGIVENNLSLDIVPPKYYSPGNTNANIVFENYKSHLKINETPHLTKPKDAEVYPSVIVEASVRWITGTVGSALTFTVSEAALIAEKNLNLFSSDLNTDLIGQMFGTTWDGRKIAANPVTNIVDVIELLIRVFDNEPDAIDTTDFDLLSNPIDGQLKNFYIGQQITDEINTAELIDELARFGFLGIVPKNNGKRSARTWLNAVSIATHSDTNGTIVEGSIGEKKQTGLEDLYNEPQVNYNWNPETNKAGSILKITRLDEDAFPIEADLDWKTYAIGYETSEYAEAKINWDLCKLSVTRYGFRASLPAEMSDAKWFPNVETDFGLAATYSAAKAYMRNICQWTPFRKDIVPYMLPNTAENAALELLNCITFSDSTDRAGAEVDGFIVRKAIVPGLGKDYIKIDLMLRPVLS